MIESWQMTRLAALLVALAAIAGLAARADAEVSRHPCVPKRAEIRFKAADGTRLAGYRLGRGTTAVVLAHQTRSDACQWASYARRLAGMGYLVIAFDFRGYGDSQARGGRAANRLSADVAAAARAARARGARKVFAVGASMGGTAVIAAGVHARPPLAGVISLSGPGDYAGESALESVPKLTAPVLYVAATGDTAFAASAQAMYGATPGERRKLTVVPGQLHGTGLLTISAEGATEATKAVEDFLTTTVPAKR